MNTLGIKVPLTSRIEQVTATRSLFFCLAVFALLCLYRVYNLWVTGFFVSDEYGYIQNAIEGSAFGNAAFGYRIFIALVDVSLFRMLAIHTVDSFILLLPFYLFFWGAATLCLAYLVLKTLGMEERVISFTLFSSFFLVSFVLLSLGFLTETASLSMAMGGILCVLRFAKSRPGGTSYLAYPLLGALAFAAARYTREPYALFLLAGVPVVAMVAVSHARSSNAKSRRKAIALAIIAFSAYSGPGLYLINNPVPLSLLAGPSIQSFGYTMTHPVITVNTTSTVSSTHVITSFSVITETANTTEVTSFGRTIVSNGTTTTTVSTTTITTNVVTTRNKTVTTTTVETVPVITQILNNQIANTLWIFFAGTALGSGPILFLVGLVGFTVLSLQVVRRIELTYLVLLLLALTSLGSYFFVSYLFSPDPNYVAFGHYSTIIRFSDTTTPAYFLTAPFAFAALGKRNNALGLLGASLILFLIVAVPAYETYAASSFNLDNNPFSLNYRSPGVQVRDYVMANPGEAPFYIMSSPNNIWFWTPGNTRINYVFFMDPLNQSQFVQRHWSVFYLYGYSMARLENSFPYLFNATQTSTKVVGNQSQPFVITGNNVIFDNQQGVFLQMLVSWTQ